MSNENKGADFAKQALKKAQKRDIRKREKSVRRETSRVISRKVISKASSVEPKIYSKKESIPTSTYNPVVNTDQASTTDSSNAGCFSGITSLFSPKVIQLVVDKIKSLFS